MLRPRLLVMSGMREPGAAAKAALGAGPREAGSHKAGPREAEAALDVEAAL